MNKWKEDLKLAFEAPCSTKKQEFLKNIDVPAMPIQDFVISQISYIRTWVWCISFIIFIVSLFWTVFLPDTVLWLISGLAPLMALTIISESGRSELYKMAELEMTIRFSLRSVIFARLVIVGVMNMILLVVLILIVSWNTAVVSIAKIFYIVTPFLLTSFIGLLVMRKIRGQEGMYACVGVSVGISMFLLLSHKILSFIYHEQYFMVWGMVALVLFAGNGKQCISLIKQTEEVVWNLS